MDFYAIALWLAIFIWWIWPYFGRKAGQDLWDENYILKYVLHILLVWFVVAGINTTVGSTFEFISKLNGFDQQVDNSGLHIFLLILNFIIFMVGLMFVQKARHKI